MDTPDTPPFSRLLVACDLHEGFEHPLAVAGRLAREIGAHLHVLHIDVVQSPPMETPAEQAHLAALRERLAAAVERVVGGAPAQVDVRQDASIVSGILQYAAEHGIGVLALGTHAHRGLRQLLLGNVTVETIRHASCPVLTVGEHAGEHLPEPAAHSLLVPVNFSEHAREALSCARRLAARLHARLDLLHVTEVRYRSPFDGAAAQAREEARQESLLAQMRTFYGEAEGPEVPEVRFELRSGPVAFEIAEHAAAHGTTLVVMGTRGRTGLSHFLAGSEAERVVRTAPCPVLTIKGSMREESASAPVQADEHAA